MALALDLTEREQFARSLNDQEAEYFHYTWRVHARPEQITPGTEGAAVQRTDWLIWLILAGRGWGKTQTGAQAIRERAQDRDARIMIVGPTTADVRDTMIEGPSGLLSCYPYHERPSWEPTKHLINFSSGAVAITRSAEEPERLRGPQFTDFWVDEIAASKYWREVWDQIMFGFRLPSTRPIRGIVTTTPKPIQLLKDLVKDKGVVLTRGSSDDNLANLDPVFIQRVLDPYRGTRLGRQEIDAEILEDVPGALWTRRLIDASRISMDQVRWDLFLRLIVAVDPAVTSNPDSDETGIVLAGLTNSGHVVILDDLSMKGSPLEWAKVVIAAYKTPRPGRLGCDRVIAEVNNGGDLVERNIRAVDASVSFRAVRASRGKYIRAEPVAALYEQGRVHHVGSFPVLEDQMCGWTPQSGEKSPDRLDALVWAVTDLVIDPEQLQQYRRIGDLTQISSI